MKKLMLIAALGLTAACALPASAAVLYDNGNTDTALNARLINYGGAVADSFTLAQDSTVTGINFQSYDFPGVNIQSIDWAITPTSDFTSDTASANVTSTYLFSQQNGYHINENTFSTGSLNLAAGTYYLLLDGAAATGGAETFWAQSDGPSTAVEGGFSSTPSESFQVLGSATATSAVPEASTWAMMIGGFGFMGGAMRRKRTKTLSLA